METEQRRIRNSKSRRLNGCATQKKEKKSNLRNEDPMGTKPRGGGAQGLNGPATKKGTVFLWLLLNIALSVKSE